MRNDPLGRLPRAGLARESTTSANAPELPQTIALPGSVWRLTRGDHGRPVNMTAGEMVSSRSMGNDSVDDSTESTLGDASLIDAMLALTPEERLRQNDRMVRTVLLLRRGWEAMKATTTGNDDGWSR